MKLEAGVLVSPAPEVPVIDGDIVTAIRDLRVAGSAAKPSQNSSAWLVTPCGGIDARR